MQKNLFKKKKIVVMGIGLHGGNVAMIKWLVSQGAKVVATDKKSKIELAPSLEKLEGLKNLTIVVGQHRMEDFESADLVIKNPMVPWSDKYIRAARANNVPVEMDSSLFFKYSPSKNIIGVTGTKGKTTTSLLIHEMLKLAGMDAVKAGIGQEAVMNKLAKVKKETWVVFELSSWRLSGLGRNKYSPKIAVVTNIFQDHLNYYPTMEKYINDKKHIYLHQKSKGTLVLNNDDEVVKGFENEANGTVAYFSLEKIDENISVFVEEGVIKYNLDGATGSICKTEDVALQGAHNLYNALAACAVGIVTQIPVKTIKEALTSFKGAKHRLEFVERINGVSFYNDTAATTPESAIAGINTFIKPVNLICGGSNKKLDLNPLAKKIANSKHIGKVYLLEGSATEILQKKIEESGGGEKVAGKFDDIFEAVRSAAENANEGGIVLLSPGCASFGMFQNEFERGDRFKEAVAALLD